MICQGTITKTINNGQKIYAVINEIFPTDFAVRFFFAGTVVEAIVAKDQCRRPSLPQNGELASYIRQTVGVAYEKPVDVSPTNMLGGYTTAVLGKIPFPPPSDHEIFSDEPEDEGIEE